MFPTSFKIILALVGASLLLAAYGWWATGQMRGLRTQNAALSASILRAQETRKRDEAISAQTRQEKRATGLQIDRRAILVEQSAASAPAWAEMAVPKEVQDVLP